MAEYKVGDIIEFDIIGNGKVWTQGVVYKVRYSITPNEFDYVVTNVMVEGQPYYQLPADRVRPYTPSKESNIMTDEVTVSAKDLEIVLNQRQPHGHTKPGIWDDDNHKSIAGQPCVECAVRERLKAAIIPPLPEEPPVGTVLRGKTPRSVWVRWDEGTKNGFRWWNVGHINSYSWDDALTMGADPNRPLVEKTEIDTKTLELAICNQLSGAVTISKLRSLTNDIVNEVVKVLEK